MQGLQIAELESLAAATLDRVRDRPPHATTLVFLLRCFGVSDRAEARNTLAEALGAALLTYEQESSMAARAEWLTVFCQASEISDDERIMTAIGSLIEDLRSAWGVAGDVGDTMCSVDACLRAANFAADGTVPLIQAAVDELERIVGQTYRPGHAIGTFRDHVWCALALLAAFDVTARLPYGMLAEELMQTAKRLPNAPSDVVVDCDAARVFCRLAALHEDANYRAAAILTPGADYRADAARILSVASHRARVEAAAAYGVALLDYLSLQ